MKISVMSKNSLFLPTCMWASFIIHILDWYISNFPLTLNRQLIRCGLGVCTDGWIVMHSLGLTMWCPPSELSVIMSGLTQVSSPQAVQPLLVIIHLISWGGMWYLHSEKRYISFKGNVHLLFVRWKWVEIVKNLTFENADRQTWYITQTQRL